MVWEWATVDMANSLKSASGTSLATQDWEVQCKRSTILASDKVEIVFEVTTYLLYVCREGKENTGLARSRFFGGGAPHGSNFGARDPSR